MSKELQDYVSQARAKGFSDKDIYDQLVEKGWGSSKVASSLGLDIPGGQTSTKVNPPSFLYSFGVSIGFIVKVIIILLYIYTVGIAVEEYKTFSVFVNHSLFFIPIQISFLVSVYSLYLTFVKKTRRPVTLEEQWRVLKGEIVLTLILAATVLPTLLFIIAATWV